MNIYIRKNMSKQDWTFKLREQLADYQQPVKDDLWAGIAASLAQQEDKKNSARKISLYDRRYDWRKWTAAAVVSLALVGGCAIYLGHKTEGGEQQLAQQTTRKTTESVKPTSSKLVDSSSVASSSISSSLLAEVVSCNPEIENVPSEAAKLEATSTVSDEAAPDNQQVQMNKMADVPRRSRNSVQDEPLYGREFVRKAKADMDWNIRLYAENGMISNSSQGVGTPVFMGVASTNSGPYVFEDASSAPYVPQIKAVHLEQAEHHAPISVGAQVGVSVSPRLSLSTGLVYTRTSSDFAMEDDSRYDKHQVLHYVGVPLSVNYEVWSLSRVHTYVMVGAEADFNVKNDTQLDGEHIDGAKRDRVQFSGKAALGVQYDVAPRVGLYLEPGVKHYFDNGSEIVNTFKDKEWNFNLQFGLRFNLK